MGGMYPNGYNGYGVDISAGATRTYRIAAVSKYTDLFYPANRNAKLVYVSTKLQSALPADILTNVCATAGQSADDCDVSTEGISTVVSIRYGSIFGQKYSTLTQFYNTFLKSTH